MEYTYSNGIIQLPNKELTIIDKLVLDFVSRIKVKYVIVSGYVAILFGRSRSTEDIDIFILDNNISEFVKFYSGIVSDGKYYAINAESGRDAYELMTIDKSSLRFAEKGTFIPNFEIKFANKKTDFYSMDNALFVDLEREPKLRISPLELAIAYKLFLGSEKDFADAKHLYITFSKILNMKKLKEFIAELPIKKTTVKGILGEI